MGIPFIRTLRYIWPLWSSLRKSAWSCRTYSKVATLRVHQKNECSYVLFNLQYLYKFACLIESQLYSYIYRILQIIQGGKVSRFRGSIDTAKLFHWNSLCNRLWPCKATIQPRNFSSKWKFSSATKKLFHLERFAIYSSIIIALYIATNQPSVANMKNWRLKIFR